MNQLSHFISQYDQILHVPIYFLLFNILWTYIVGELTGNCSQVDRVWTFLPPIYTTYYALLPLLPFSTKDIQEAGLNHRVVLMALLQVVWMTRLTYNTWRRGLFAMNEEDYRWQLLRNAMSVPTFKVFHLVFIATMQNGILYGLSYPAYLVLRHPNTPLGVIDAILGLVALLVILIEFTADNQQYSFQTFKHSKPQVQRPTEEEWIFAKQRWTQADAKKGYVNRGLWAWSRHPNFAAEQAFWWIMVFFPILTGPKALELPSLDEIVSPSSYRSLSTFLEVYASLGPLVPGIIISALFLGSTAFTESVTAKKYAGYKAYQRRVGMFSPMGTLLHGLYLSWTGEKREIDELIWGSGKSENEAKAE